MKASILIVGHPFPHKIEFGADHSPSYDAALEILRKENYAVVVTADRLPSTATQVKTSGDFLRETRKLHPDTQSILISGEASPQELQRAINDFGLFKIVPEFDGSILQLAVREALEEYELIKQNQAFLKLTQEQNTRLQHLTSLLEERVKARELFLIEAREKLLHAAKKTEALNRALVAIQRSVTRQEIERLLNDALHVTLGLNWIRILFHDQTFLDHLAGGEQSTKNNQIFSAPLFREKELLGHIYFARDQSTPFSTDEDDFLLQISDAVGLAIDRLRALEDTERLKQEWDSTFDAITDPVAIIESNYDVIRGNRAYARSVGLPMEEISGKKCYEILFKEKKPCANCHLGQSFDLGEKQCGNGSNVHFSVTSSLAPVESGRESYALFYRDVGEEERIQRQILESSKMAEIGTIGSSIAHEINNPLGGMIAFLQILKGELKATEALYPDVVEMEQAAIRCKTIVENLLTFTRAPGGAENQVTRLGDLLKLVVNIMEIQTRGLGIKINQVIENLDVNVTGDTNQLVQVLVNVMQNNCEAIAERMSAGIRHSGIITIRGHVLPTAPTQLQLELLDNGTGIPAKDLARVFTPFFSTKDRTKNPGLGLSVSYQIVKEHGGQMEIYSYFGNSQPSTTVIVQLPLAKKLDTPTNF